MDFAPHGIRCGRRLVVIASLLEVLARVSSMVAAAEFRRIFDKNFDFIFLLFLNATGDSLVFRRSHEVALAIHTGPEMKLFPGGGWTRVGLPKDTPDGVTLGRPVISLAIPEIRAIFGIRRLVGGHKICRLLTSAMNEPVTGRGIRPLDDTLIQSMNQ
jgi:hypothetical protein